MTINEYYTALKSVWEELESLDQLPTLSESSEDVKRFLEAFEKQKEEKRLFQLLNGLDESYGPLRSQILMITPLPIVDFICSSLRREESRRNLLNSMKGIMATSTMFSRGVVESMVCSACGIKGHKKDRCWTIISYPKKHIKYKQPFRGKKGNTRMASSNHNWERNRNPSMAANAQESGILGQGSEISMA